MTKIGPENQAIDKEVRAEVEAGLKRANADPIIDERALLTEFYYNTPPQMVRFFNYLNTSTQFIAQSIAGARSDHRPQRRAAVPHVCRARAPAVIEPANERECLAIEFYDFFKNIFIGFIDYL